MSSNTTTANVTSSGSASGAQFSLTQKLGTNGFYLVLLLGLSIFLFGDASFISEKNPSLSKKCMSKLYLLPEVDRWQNHRSDAPFKLSDDPSAALEHIPNEIFSQNSSATVPLWNDLSGAGRPFAGEFQTLNWSILRQWFPFHDWPAYNFGIFFKLVLAGLSAYFLSLRLGNSALSSFMAASGFMLCPRLLRWAELCNNYFGFPLLILSFLWGGAKPSLLRAVPCAGIVAALAYNMHPETFACAVVAGAIVAMDDYFKNAFRRGASVFFGFADWLRWTVLIAILSLALTAPLILPFLEFIANSTSYKFNTDVVAFLNSGDFLADLFLPVGDLRYFCGTALGLLLFTGIAKFWGERKILLLTFFATAIFCARPGVLETLFASKPFVFLLPEYPLGTCALLQACIAAGGVDALFRNRKLASRFQANCLVIFPSLLGILVVIGQTKIGAEFFAHLSDGFVYNRPAMPPLLLLVALSTCIFAGLVFSARLSKKGTQLARCIFLLLNTLSLILAVPIEYVPGKGYSYRELDELKLVHSSGARMIATGFSTFQPNTNLLYNIDDFRAFAPIHPRRYQEFCTAAGIGSKYCFLQNCPDALGPLFDLASVKYILTDRALSTANAQGDSNAFRPSDARAISAIAGPIKLSDGLRYQNAILFYSSSEQMVNLNVEFFFDPSMQARYICRPILTDAAGHTVYAGKWNSESIDKDANPLLSHRYMLKMSLPLPQKIESAKALYVCLLIKDSWTDAPLKLGSAHSVETDLGRALRLGSFNSPASTGNSSSHLKRICDTADGFFLYENMSALPRAYLVHNTVTVKTSADSLAALQRKIDWRNYAVIEDPHADEEMRNPGESELQRSDRVRVLDRDSDSILLRVESKAPSYLILTDTFFPGWVAELDSKKQEILPANHAFRAIKVPTGVHYVKFSYEPESFTFGLFLMKVGACLSFILFTLGAIFEWRNSSLRKNKEISGTGADTRST